MENKEEKVLLEATLCYLVRDGSVLLARKTRKIGEGMWNGYGGGLETGETLEEAVLRELEEEAKVIAVAKALSKVAILDMENHKVDGSIFNCRIHVYLVDSWIDEPRETGEMATPTWFRFDQIPVDELMPADKVWLPVVLAGKKIQVRATYAPFQSELIGEVQIEEVEKL